MSQSTQNMDLQDPFADIYSTQSTPKSVSFRLGEKLGRFFLVFKGKINQQYQAVTKGIHHQVEAEAEMERLAQEQWLQEQVEYISAQYHSQLKRLQYRYAFISFMTLLIGVVCGVAAMIYF
ncbi:hypothetical protein FW755_09350 [Lonepinella koalarum]|uniref:hypothetical protein n=1 Tax=Lonepinella koalarum TaxID=53417 RepID=UPI0011E3E0D6|nr:hypothetical protein [Lonepinella koalarum]TYG35282.1 hypothetical protein FW755_09350 [Lonepinella koalarum]